MIKPSPIVVAFAFITLPVSFSSQAETELRPIVTASRIAQTADQTLSAVTVITREDIEQSQSHSVSDILRSRVPGIDFLTSGGVGHQVSPFIRGTNSDHLLFIIDGNIIGSATTGAAQLELIPLEQLERIEVIRGPRSSLYGSDAIGGVVQVFTRSGGNSHQASMTIGSHNTRAHTLALNSSNDRSQFNIASSQYKTHGFNATNDNEHDDDGYQSDTINLHASHKLGDTASIHFNLLNTEADTEFDNNSFDNESSSIQQSFSTGIKGQLEDNWHTSLQIGLSRDDLDTLLHYEDFFSPGSFIQERTLFITRREQAHWQNEISFAENGQIAFGFDYLKDEVESSSAYSETERENKAIYLLVQNKHQRHQFQFSGRMDENQAFGTQHTGNVAWSYDINGEMLLNLSHGTAFIAPSFNDLYFVDPFFSGNPDLSPETSRTSELGLTGYHSWGEWSTRAYHTEITNLIVLNNSFTSVENAEKAEIDGLEIELSTNIYGWDSQLSISAINPINKSTNTVLQGRAKRTVKLNISQDFSGYKVGASILAQSPRFANASNTIELSAYNTIDLMLEKSLGKNWQLEARLENLMDKDYATSIDFFGNPTNNTPISLFVTLSYHN